MSSMPLMTSRARPNLSRTVEVRFRVIGSTASFSSASAIALRTARRRAGGVFSRARDRHFSASALKRGSERICARWAAASMVIRPARTSSSMSSAMVKAMPASASNRDRFSERPSPMP